VDEFTLTWLGENPRKSSVGCFLRCTGTNVDRKVNLRTDLIDEVPIALLCVAFFLLPQPKPRYQPGEEPSEVEKLNE